MSEFASPTRETPSPVRAGVRHRRGRNTSDKAARELRIRLIRLAVAPAAGVLLLMVYLIFAMTLYLLPPKSAGEGTPPKKTTERSIQRAHDAGNFTSLGATAPERSLCCVNFS